ncbi:MAG: hypothetical protein WAK40_02340 [Thermoplasmata archaeon]
MESLTQSRISSLGAVASPFEEIVPFRLDSIEVADTEFLGLPPPVREVFITAFRELAVSDSPVALAPGWFTEELRQDQRIAPEGLFSLHVGDLWRGVFFRRGRFSVFIAFGFRLPDFYAKLERLRRAVAQRAPGSQQDR